MTIEPGDVLEFWRSAGPDKWFTRSDAFDREASARFLNLYDAVCSGALRGWESTPEGALALLIVLDQLPRNMFRNEPRAFAADPLAREVAERALSRGFDVSFQVPERRFFYLPFMHSEALADQERCVALCRAADDEEGAKFAAIHADIIRRFGRFPHRNRVLGRFTTPEEQAFLDAGGFAG